MVHSFFLRWLARALSWRPAAAAGPVALCAAIVFSIANFSPIEWVDSDPGIGLLVSQSLLDHGSLRLDAYHAHPDCAYDFENDYRIRQRDGSYYYYSVGVPVLSVPLVWTANRCGYHMVDQRAEYALQNLVSAACCVLIFLLLYRLCRCYVGRTASLLVAGISVLGSPLISTLGTGLWNTNYSVAFVLLAVSHLARRQAQDPGRHPNYGYVGLLLAAAFVCRPASGIAVLAISVYLLPGNKQSWQRLLVVCAGLASALLVAAAMAYFLGGQGWLRQFGYYSPLRLVPKTPWTVGVPGVLWSPSRGLLVFCPFLIPVVIGSAWRMRRLFGDGMFRLALMWIVLQILAIAGYKIWWGGHCFGPRLLVETIVPFALLTCLLWKDVRQHAPRKWCHAAGALYLGLGLLAVSIHSYQGLFNPWTRVWNERPNIDRHPELAFDWKFPQAWASEAMIVSRSIDLQRRETEVYVPGRTIAHEDDCAIFVHWWHPEEKWRWSNGTWASIILRVDALDDRADYALDLHAGALGRQQVLVQVNEIPVGELELEGHAPVTRRIHVPRNVLRAHGENTIRFEIPGATSPPKDTRQLGLSFRSLRLLPLAIESPSAGSAEDGP